MTPLTRGERIAWALAVVAWVGLVVALVLNTWPAVWVSATLVAVTGAFAVVAFVLYPAAVKIGDAVLRVVRRVRPAQRLRHDWSERRYPSSGDVVVVCRRCTLVAEPGCWPWCTPQ